jgi:hypothetical protein
MAHSERRGTRSDPRATRPTRVENMRRGLRQLFTGTSVVERATLPEGRKTARLELSPQDFSSASITLPHPFRVTTAPATLSTPSSAASNDSPFPTHTPLTSRPITPNSLRDMQRAMSLPLPATQRSSRLFVGVDPEERYLADLAARGRRRQSKRTRGARRRRSCVLNFKDRKVRSKVIACCLSAIFLIIILTICKFSVISPHECKILISLSPDLALVLSNREESQEFHVLLILIILLTTIFFCHSLISLCMVAIRTPDVEERPRMSLIGPGGYANPPRPIPVALARDEEAAGIESEVTKFPPPAYGLWRESVVCINYKHLEAEFTN